MAQEGVETAVEALSRLDLPSSIIVEAFVCSHNAGVLKALASKVNRKATYLRLRRVLLRYHNPHIL